MGLGAEELYMREIDEEIAYQRYMDNVNAGIWVDINFKQHKISEMSTGYIQNCINLIKREKNWRDEYLPIFENELIKRA